MYESATPVEFKSLLDPVWKQQQQERLLELIQKEIEKDQSPASAVRNINNEFDLLSITIKKHFMTLMLSSLQFAQKAAYEEAGIENYKVIAIVDDNICEKCSEADDSVFSVKDYEIAKTAPPYHFYCRCTTMPYTAEKTITHNANVLFIKEFISEAFNITRENLSWSILDMPSKVKEMIEFASELIKVAEALHKGEISIDDVMASIRDNVKDAFVGDLIYVFENYKKFSNLSELPKQDIKYLAGRTVGAYEEAVSIGFMIYGITKSLSQTARKANIPKTNADKISKGAGQYADDVVEGAGKGSLKVVESGNYSASEIKDFEYMRDLGNDVTLRSTAGTRAGGGTSDLVVNGINYDVYTPTTSNPSRIIGAIAEKNSQATGIVLDLSKTSVTA